MGENILALLTLAITIPTSVIGLCALFDWWRHRRTNKSMQRM
jgi:NADH:ubiquinone oxidoreductase subunit K